MGRRMHSFHSEEHMGTVLSSGSEWSRPFMALAPYTFPLVTYLMLALRAIIIPQ